MANRLALRSAMWSVRSMRRPADLSFTFLPAKALMVRVPTSHAPIPKLSAVLSKSDAPLLRPGIRGHRSTMILPSMVVHMWQMT